MPATFRVDHSFTIKGRGLVIAGQIATGKVQLGGMVTLPDSKGAQRARRITSVEAGNGLDADGQVRGFVGIVLGKLPVPDVAAAQAHLTKGFLLAVSDPEAGTPSLFPGLDQT